LRAMTTHLPHSLLVAVVWLLYAPLRAYMMATRVLPLPLRRYMTDVLGRLDGEKIRLVIYDQLNPAQAKYYTRDEVIRLFTAAGFEQVRLYHRHGYGWAVQALKSVPQASVHAS